MSRLRQLLSEKPLVAAYVAAAVTALAAVAHPTYDKIDRIARTLDGELLTVSQAAYLDESADKAMHDLAFLASRLKTADQIDDAAAFRAEMQEVSDRLHRVHYPMAEGKTRRSPDPLAVYADQLQAKGVALQSAIFMVRSWEHATRIGSTAEAEEAREVALRVLDEKLGPTGALLSDGTNPDSISVAYMNP